MPGRIHYRFNHDEKTVTRNVETYEQVLGGEPDGEISRVVAAEVLECVFEFYKFQRDESEVKWERSWTEQCLPSTIHVRVGYQEGNGVKRLTRTMPVPVQKCVSQDGS